VIWNGLYGWSCPHCSRTVEARSVVVLRERAIEHTTKCREEREKAAKRERDRSLAHEQLELFGGAR
jgi:hypothetical protein